MIGPRTTIVTLQNGIGNVEIISDAAGGDIGDDEADDGGFFGLDSRRGFVAIFGRLAGVGAAVLLQQFAVAPMTPMLMIGVPAGTAMIGLALGWPKAVAAVTAAA